MMELFYCFLATSYSW